MTAIIDKNALNILTTVIENFVNRMMTLRYYLRIFVVISALLMLGAVFLSSNSVFSIIFFLVALPILFINKINTLLNKSQELTGAKNSLVEFIQNSDDIKNKLPKFERSVDQSSEIKMSFLESLKYIFSLRGVLKAAKTSSSVAKNVLVIFTNATAFLSPFTLVIFILSLIWILVFDLLALFTIIL